MASRPRKPSTPFSQVGQTIRKYPLWTALVFAFLVAATGHSDEVAGWFDVSVVVVFFGALFLIRSVGR